MWTLYIPQVLLCLPRCLPQPHCRLLHLHSHFICLLTDLSNSEIISGPCGYFTISVSTSRLLTARKKPPVAHSSISKVPADLPFDLLLTMFPSQPLTIQLSESARGNVCPAAGLTGDQCQQEAMWPDQEIKTQSHGIRCSQKMQT